MEAFSCAFIYSECIHFDENEYHVFYSPNILSQIYSKEYSENFNFYHIIRGVLLLLLDILHSVHGIGKSFTGLGQVVVNLALSQQALGHNVKIWCLDKTEDIEWASAKRGFPIENIRRFPLIGPRMFWYSPSMERDATGIVGKQFNILHQHGIWTGNSRATLKMRENHGTPTIIAPHGALNSYALKRSAWKKIIALNVYEANNLKRASCLHATSENEISAFRDFGLSNPIAFISNCIAKSRLTIHGNKMKFREQYAVPGDRRVLLFLSRISPIKGLMMLVQAIQKIPYEFNGWQLIIAGIDEFNHKVEVESLIKRLRLEDSIKIIGPLSDQAALDAFEAAELFILPSYSEGFPTVVMESLAAGVPVITTKATQDWQKLITFDCGWWIDANVDAIIEALKNALVLSSDQLLEMGERGKNLIEMEYTWDTISPKTINLYYWLLGDTNKPDFVFLK